MLKRITCIVSILFVMLIAAPWASAQPLADKVPDDAFFYAGWRGTDAMPGAFANSHFKAFLDSSNLPAVMHDTLPKVLALAAKKGGPDAYRAVHIVETLITPMWKYPTAVYFYVDLGGGQPVPKGAFICQAGKEAAVIKQTIDELMTGAQMPPFPVRTFIEGDIVGIAVGYDEGASALVGGEGNKSKSLGASNTFANAMGRIGAVDPMLVVHVDGERLMQLIEDGVAMAQQPELTERWPKIREATGLAGFRRALMTAGFDGKDWSARAFVEAPSPRRGLLAMGDSSPLDDATLKLVPVTATSFAAGGFDPAKAITQLREIVGEVDADAGVKFDQGLGVVQMYVGKSLVKDILEPLGEQWVMYDDPNVAGFGFGGGVLVNKLDDPVKANQGLGALAIAINNTLAGAMKNQDVRISIKRTTVGDLTINYVAIPLIAPAWAIKDGNLYVGLFPQVVASAVHRAGEAGSKSILDNADFQTMRKRLGVDRPTSLSYANQHETVMQSYQMSLFASRGLLGAADLFGIDAPAFILPSLGELQKHLGLAGSASWADEQGYYAKHISPFPGSEIVSGQVSMLGAIGPAAMAAGAIGDRMDKAHVQVNINNDGNAPRGTARETCAANLKQIGLACQQFANEHNGDLPPDLGAIGKYIQSSGPRRGDVFLCPAHKRNSDTAKLTEDQFESWIKENSDYVYLGEGSTMRSPPETLIAHEKPDAHSNGAMNLLFLDGHVEFHNAEEAQRIIEAKKR